MAQDAIKKLMSNRDAIRQIMAMDANGTMDGMVENAQKNGNLMVDENGVLISKARKPVNKDIQMQHPINESSHPNMPKQILESFKKNPGRVEKTKQSVLDDVDFEPIRENKAPQSITPNTMVDYSLIKTIVNEAVQETMKKYISEMGKSMLTESAGNNLVAIKLSNNKFRFLTENGDIYIADLHYKRNANDIDKKK